MPKFWQSSSHGSYSKRMQAEKLRDAAQSKDTAAVQAVGKDFGRLACGTCHTPFRVPPKQ